MKNRVLASKIQLLVTPSWLSGLISVATGVAIVLATFLMTNIQHSGLTTSIFSVSNFTGGNNYQSVATNLSKYPIINYMPLYLFWAGTGTIVYFLAVHVYKAFSDVVNIKNRLNYVNAHRREIVRQALLHLMVRLATLIVWIVFIVYTLNHILPYALFEVHSMATRSGLHSYLVLAYATGIIALTVSVHVILLRLLLLRVRLVGGAVE